MLPFPTQPPSPFPGKARGSVGKGGRGARKGERVRGGGKGEGRVEGRGEVRGEGKGGESVGANKDFLKEEKRKDFF